MARKRGPLSAAHRAAISASLRRGRPATNRPPAGKKKVPGQSVEGRGLRGRAKAMGRARIAVQSTKSGKLRGLMARSKVASGRRSSDINQIMNTGYSPSYKKGRATNVAKGRTGTFKARTSTRQIKARIRR